MKISKAYLSDRLDQTADFVKAMFRSSPARPDWCDKIKRVVLILSGSRSGSSLLKTLISNSSRVLTLSGEEDPYFAISKNIFPFASDSDALATLNNLEFVKLCIANDMGRRNLMAQANLDKLLRDWSVRFLLQYPESVAVWKPEYLSTKAQEVLEEQGLRHWSYEDANKFVMERGGLNRRLYDLTKNSGDLLDPVEGPPDPYKVEELPYVIPLNLDYPSPIDLEQCPLILKTPQDAYRLPIFEQLFPNAIIGAIHLTRGLGQTVHSLCDGWEYDRGFFSHNVSVVGRELDIKGYTDRFPLWGSEWWNFDLPPGWESYAQAPLHKVAAYQWYSANVYARSANYAMISVSFEEILNVATRQVALERICKFIRIPVEDVCPPAKAGLPEVMTTSKPAKFDWKKREAEIDELFRYQHYRDLHHEMGYTEDKESWI